MTQPPPIEERVWQALAGAAIGSMLVALVAASFVVTPRVPARTELAAAKERAAPIARGGDTRDLALERPTEPALTAFDDTGPMLDATAASTAEPTPVPTPEPTAAPTPAPTIAPAVRPTAAPPRPAPVVTSSTQEAELRMLTLMNGSRAAGGLVALTLDATVTATARAHSLAESAVGYVYHDGPDGLASVRDAAACGTGWYGENTGKVWGGSVDRLHLEFMAEPWVPINHRTNIMDPNFRRVGIGAVQGADALYMTMVFCR